MKGSIVSICSVNIENCCRALSRFDRCRTFAVLVLRAFDIHVCIGWLVGSDLIRMTARRVFVWSLIQVGCSSASISMAAVGVVL